MFKGLAVLQGRDLSVPFKCSMNRMLDEVYSLLGCQASDYSNDGHIVFL